MKDNISDLMDWIFPPKTTPNPCPHNHIPTLVQYKTTSHFECRSWFGLRKCHEGPSVLEGIGDGEYARNAAAIAWNRMLERRRK